MRKEGIYTLFETLSEKEVPSLFILGRITITSFILTHTRGAG